MNIFVDARWIRTDYHDGISRYSAGIIKGLHENNVPFTVIVHDEAQLNMLPSGLPYVKLNSPVSFKELFIAPKINRLKADVVFSPFQIMGARGRKYKLILTLHDTIYYRYPAPPSQLSKPIKALWRAYHSTYLPQRYLLSRADMISTVSEVSKDYIDEYRLTKKPVDVVYNASGIDLSSIDRSNLPKEKHIIYMGSFMGYKNVETLIKGMQYLPKEYVLNLVGNISDKRKEELSKFIPKKSNVIFQGSANDTRIVSFFNIAHCLVSASKEEGFGLPIVEAQTAGVPVVCSDMKIFHEVAGDGALYFDSSSPKDFAEQVLRLKDDKLRDSLIEKFSWKKSGEKLASIIQDLANS